MSEELVLIKKLEVVECDKCHKEWKAESDNFFTFYGNVTIGLYGGIIGNNLETLVDGTFRVKRALVYCLPCTDEIFKEAKAI